MTASCQAAPQSSQPPKAPPAPSPSLRTRSRGRHPGSAAAPHGPHPNGTCSSVQQPLLTGGRPLGLLDGAATPPPPTQCVPPRDPCCPQAPRSGRFLFTQNIYSRHFPGAWVTMGWLCFLESSGERHSGQEENVRKKRQKNAQTPSTRRGPGHSQSMCCKLRAARPFCGPHPLISRGSAQPYSLKVILWTCWGLVTGWSPHTYLILAGRGWRGCRMAGSLPKGVQRGL